MKRVSLLSRGFTLIELLVVFSIISLLSSVILASLQGAREKSRIAAGATFATHIFRALGADVEAHYGFTEGPGATTITDFFRKHPGTFPGALANPTWDPSVPLGSGYSLNFIPANTQRVILANTMTIPAKFTISAWIKTINNDAEVHPIFSNVSVALAQGRITFSVFQGKLWASSGGFGVAGSVRNVNDSKWHHVAWSSDGTTATFYIDGKKDTSAPLITVSNTDIESYIGFGGYNGKYFDGNIDDLAIYPYNI